MSLRRVDDALAAEVEKELQAHAMPLGRALFWLASGLTVLIVSSKLLVWGAVTIATTLGVSEVVIGLTIVAVGTSLPEVASTLAVVRRGEADMAMGNVIGSNLFNTLAVVGLAGVISPMTVGPEILYRDMSIMCGFTWRCSCLPLASRPAFQDASTFEGCCCWAMRPTSAT